MEGFAVPRMRSEPGTLVVATRGSALALAQTHAVVGRCRSAFPDLSFSVKEVKTTGDRLQSAGDPAADQSLPKGLFTKELEAVLLSGEADLAVHSLKDVPTELPPGLSLGAVCPREDVREVLITKRPFSQGEAERPESLFSLVARIGTGSPRRKAQLLAIRPELDIVPLRGNVPTRLRRLSERGDMDAVVLAAAGIRRLGYDITASGALRGPEVPEGLHAMVLPTDWMLPCVGQGAVAIECREADEGVLGVREKLHHKATGVCAGCERAFLQALGGGCQTPVAALAVFCGGDLRLRAADFAGGRPKKVEGTAAAEEWQSLGRRLAARLK